MKKPKDFPKALAVLTVAEVVVFTLAACIGYAYNGQYSTAPLFGSLQEPYMYVFYLYNSTTLLER